MLAIVIPYYKISFFEATLCSLANQTDKRFKVYIGNDASPENLDFVLKKYLDKFEFFYKKFDQNLGNISLTKQWERCIDLSKGEEWIMILGDDDVLGENVVEEFYNNITQICKVSNVVRFATYKINGKSKLVSDIYTHPNIEKSIDFFFRQTRSSLSEYIFKKDKIEEIGFKNLPLAWHSDVLAVLEFSDFGNVFTINEAQVYVRISDISISGKISNKTKKNQASSEFFYYLIKSKKKYFNKNQYLILLTQLEKTYFNDKKNIFLLLKILIQYARNFMPYSFGAFLFNIIKNILKYKK